MPPIGSVVVPSVTQRSESELLPLSPARKYKCRAMIILPQVKRGYLAQYAVLAEHRSGIGYITAPRSAPTSNRPTLRLSLTDDLRANTTKGGENGSRVGEPAPLKACTCASQCAQNGALLRSE